MNLYIMTRGRVGKQYTWSRLPETIRRKTRLVIPADEQGKHGNIPTITAPSSVTNYSQKFQWILDGFPPQSGPEGQVEEPDKAVILDDDLVFSRKEGESLKTIYDSDLLHPLFDQMEELLDEYALVGVHPRQMGQNAKAPFVLNGRIICMQGINRRLIGKVKVDQFPILADVVLNCTLLSRGQANAIITTFFQDHGPCQASGGCSLYRTADMQRDAVEYIARRWPEFAKVVERRVKTNWLQNEEGVRYDYTCQWKRLYAAGLAHILDPGKVPNPDKETVSPTETLEWGSDISGNILLQRPPGK